jgi:pimeloyl-ACP methyl ester carboxylesterase
MPEYESGLPLTELQVPDLVRPEPSSSPPRQLALKAAKAALHTAYRVMQPDAREPFLQAPDGLSVTRLNVDTEDGWRIPLLRLPPVPGATGEPVMLLHGLGFNHKTLTWERNNSLAWGLRDAGFTVYLVCHRGDALSIAPNRAAEGFDFDDIAEQDLPAAADVVCQDSGFEKLHFVGHALGGQLLYAWLALDRGRQVASASTLCAATRFPRPTTAARAAGMARQLLPERLRLPNQRLATLISPAVRAGGDLSSALGARRVSGEILRGILVHGAADTPVGLLRQVLYWLDVGYLCDRTGRLDYMEALSGLRVPLQVIACEGDEICRPEQALEVLDVLRGPRDQLIMDGGWGHLDPLLAPDARKTVIPRVIGWLNEHRSQAWEEPESEEPTVVLVESA